MALTIKEIDGAKPADKPYKLADGGGLRLLVPPSGAKLWRWRYRFAGKEEMMALGEYPLVCLKEARERHAEARKALANEIDPMAERSKGDVPTCVHAMPKSPQLSVCAFATPAVFNCVMHHCAPRSNSGDHVSRDLTLSVAG